MNKLGQPRSEGRNGAARMNTPEELRRLTAEYKIATGHYAWAVAEVNRQIATGSAEDWQKLGRGGTHETPTQSNHRHRRAAIVIAFR
jgi:lactate dehydrogenase-like 2-hydroxyacid dehydrogenase